MTVSDGSIISRTPAIPVRAGIHCRIHGSCGIWRVCISVVWLIVRHRVVRILVVIVVTAVVWRCSSSQSDASPQSRGTPSPPSAAPPAGPSSAVPPDRTATPTTYPAAAPPTYVSPVKTSAGPPRTSGFREYERSNRYCRGDYCILLEGAVHIPPTSFRFNQRVNAQGPNKKR